MTVSSTTEGKEVSLPAIQTRLAALGGTMPRSGCSTECSSCGHASMRPSGLMRIGCSDVIDHRRPSAKNLLQYLALRQLDLRSLQEELSHRGLSSLGRCEANVHATLNAVIEVLYRLSGQRPSSRIRLRRSLLRGESSAAERIDFGVIWSRTGVRRQCTHHGNRAERSR